MMNVLNSSLVLLNSSKPVMATIALAFSFLNTSFVLIVMNFEFIALIIIIVYIGAIIILFLFTIMLLHIKDDIYLTGRDENAMLYFTFSFLYFFYFSIIILIITEGESLEDSFINTTINLVNSISMNEFLHQTTATVQDSRYFIINKFSGDNVSIVNLCSKDAFDPYSICIEGGLQQEIVHSVKNLSRDNVSLEDLSRRYASDPSSVTLKEFLQQATILHSSKNLSGDNVSTYNIYRKYLSNPSEGRLIYSNLSDLVEFYSKYDLLSKDPTLCFREITTKYAPLPGINGQLYFSYLELPKSDLNISLTYALHDYRQFLWEKTIYEPNLKVFINSGDETRTDAIISGMRFLDYFKNALNGGLLKTYNLTNPTVATHYPPVIFKWPISDFIKSLIKEYQIQVDFGALENFGTGLGMNSHQGFCNENRLVVPQMNISDLFSSFGFINNQNLINESLSTRSCNKDLELETELQGLGIVLYTVGCVYFILASIILLIALIGSVVLITSDSTEFIEIQQTSNQLSKKKSYWAFSPPVATETL